MLSNGTAPVRGYQCQTDTGGYLLSSVGREVERGVKGQMEENDPVMKKQPVISRDTE